MSNICEEKEILINDTCKNIDGLVQDCISNGVGTVLC